MEVPNSCDKVVFQISVLDQVKRFLSLGSENGTYYVQGKDLTKMNLEIIDKALEDASNRFKLLDIINDYAKNQKCKKQDPLVFLLAKCCSYGVTDKDMIVFRTKAYELVPTVCYIPTTLFMFIDFTKKLYKQKYISNGWNNLHKRGVSSWYKTKNPMSLLYQVTKYKDRCGYTHKDVMRLAHIKPENEEQKFLFKYIAKGIDNISCEELVSGNELVDFAMDYERIKNATDEDMVVQTIKKWKMAREHVPTNLLNSPAIWEVLLPQMPGIALLRNLNKLTMCGLLDDQTYVDYVCEKIRNVHEVHPVQLLIAMKMYAAGKGHKGSNTWTPVQSIVECLNSRFYELFKDCKPTNKRICIAMDVSGSMHYSNACGTECMTAAEISCALAMVMKDIDPFVDIMGFSNSFIPLTINSSDKLNENLDKIRNIPFMSTDISLPFTWALENRKHYDAFIVLTDSETNCNSVKPVDALRKYRSDMCLPFCKLVVVAMAANNFTIADPNDKNMLDVAGFDASVPDVINSFLMDEF